MTKIEWTEATWNPIVGCSIVSPGCTNCYAMRMAARLEAMSKTQFPHYQGTTKASKAGAVWTGKVAMASDTTLAAPLRRKKPTMYFVNSMGDLFHEDVPDAWIDRVFSVMAIAEQHTFQILTKRSARMRAYMAAGPASQWVDTDVWKSGIGWPEAAAYHGSQPDRLVAWGQTHLSNVWLGVSTERQQEADARIPDLLATPAAVRFVSAEPLLGGINFRRLQNRAEHPLINDELDALNGTRRTRTDGGHWQRTPGHTPRLDWIIVGGESGPDARPMHPDWARSIRDQCTAANVPFFFKQWGEWAPGENCGAPATRTEQIAWWFGDEWRFDRVTAAASREGHRDDEPDLYRIGKSRSGRHLDGRTHDAMPATQRSEVAA